jgi:polygalacturonase
MQVIKNIQDFGGMPSAIDNSKAFAAAKEFFEKNGGGTLVVQKGLWYTGPVELCSHMTLELEAGAVVSFIPEPSLYRPVKTRWEGVTSWAMHPCVFASGADHVKICGNGVFDGSGQEWWKSVPEKKLQKKPLDPIEKELASLNPGYENQPGGGGGRSSQFLRPPLMQFYECTDVDVCGVTLQNSPFWTFHPVFCSRLNIHDVTVCNPHDAPNTDGMDIDSCTDVVIEKCRISVGDDGIAIKSGSGEDGIRINRPSRNITVKGCTVEDGHGGVVIGSETAAGIDTVKVMDCRFEGTDRGIRIKTRRGRGGVDKGPLF